MKRVAREGSKKPIYLWAHYRDVDMHSKHPLLCEWAGRPVPDTMVKVYKPPQQDWNVLDSYKKNYMIAVHKNV